MKWFGKSEPKGRTVFLKPPSIDYDRPVLLVDEAGFVRINPELEQMIREIHAALCEEVR